MGNQDKRMPAVRLRDVMKAYDVATGQFIALDHVDLDIAQGEFVAIVGKSGSGKTTLLNLLAGIDRATEGDVIVDQTSLGSLSESELSEWRGRHVGLVFQFFQLLPTLTIVENIQLPMDFVKRLPVRERRTRALRLLDQVGIEDQADKFPAMLSGGQQQRAAIARALANDPPILLCDEPTGNLDSANRNAVFKLFAELNAAGRTIIMVTHERDASSFTSRQVTLVDGRVSCGPEGDGCAIAGASGISF